MLAEMENFGRQVLQKATTSVAFLLQNSWILSVDVPALIVHNGQIRAFPENSNFIFWRTTYDRKFETAEKPAQ
jgi:hypothetical protein